MNLGFTELLSTMAESALNLLHLSYVSESFFLLLSPSSSSLTAISDKMYPAASCISSSENNISVAGNMRSLSISEILFCDSALNVLMLSTLSPQSSILTGVSDVTSNISIIPPLMAN